MCCTFEPATLSNTIIYAAEVMRSDGLAHVIGYQNSVSSRRGPNAMLLPFPAEGRVGRENLVNGAAFKNILRSYEKAVDRLRPRRRSLMKGMFLGDEALLGAVASHEVFESGSYTIALAQRADGLLAALPEIPVEKRPALTKPFVDALSKLYPDWPIALCCFNGSMAEAEPLFWWFRPRFPEVLFAPAIDAHDGRPPSLEHQVHRDHTVAYASYASGRQIDATLQGEIERQVPFEHRWLFDPRVCGRKFEGSSRNGDFVHDLDAVRDPKVPGWFDLKVQAPPQDRPDKWAHLLADAVI